MSGIKHYVMKRCISVLKEMIDIREGRGSCEPKNIEVLHIINDIFTN